MKNIKGKFGSIPYGINKKWILGFKSEAEFTEAAMKLEGLQVVPEGERAAIVKDAWAKSQPAKEAPAVKPAKG